MDNDKLELLEYNKQVEFYSLKELKEYPYREYIRSIIYRGDEQLSKGDLPIGGVLKCVNLSNFNLTNTDGGVIPNGVTDLYYPFENESSSINLTGLPTSVTAIYNYEFIVQSENITDFTKQIPSHINSISFRCYSIFNEKIGSSYFSKIPNHIISLTFGDAWNNGNTTLKRGDLNNEGNLKTLGIYGYNLTNQDNEIIDSFIPRNIDNLTIGHCSNFNLSNKNLLPEGLKSLYIGSQFNKGITIPGDSLPSGLESFKIMSSGIIIDEFLNLNKSIKKLKIYIGLKEESERITKEIIPCNLESLTVSTVSNLIENDSYPSTLRSLNYSLSPNPNEAIPDQIKNFNYKFPNTITDLSINLPIEIYKHDLIPPSVRTLNLTFYKQDCTLTKGVLNEDLEKLKLSYNFNQDLKDIELPSSLLEFEIGGLFNKKIVKGDLPNRLKVLKFDKFGKFNQKFEFDSLPNQLLELYLPKEYNQEISSPGILPDTLKVLHIPTSLKTNNLINDASIPTGLKMLKFI